MALFSGNKTRRARHARAEEARKLMDIIANDNFVIHVAQDTVDRVQRSAREHSMLTYALSCFTRRACCCCHPGDSNFDLTFRTAVEYVLLAPHKDSGLPMVAAMTYEEDEEYFDKIRSMMPHDGQHWTAARLICYYAEEKRGVIPATALRYFADYSMTLEDMEELLKTALETWGSYLAPAGTKNSFDETILMVFGKHYHSLDLFRTFMDVVPGAKEAIDLKDSTGCTIAHYFAKLNRVKHLQVLAELGADLNIENMEKRTPKDFASSRGHSEALSLFDAAGQASGIAPSFSGLASQNFPKIFLPSDPAWDPQSTERIIVEYLRRELPELLKMDPSLVMIPPEVPLPNDNPYPEGSIERNGWDAENTVLRGIHNALKDLHSMNPNLHIACFHDLRYGCTLKAGQKWESDIDVAVLCSDSKASFVSAVLFEVKNISKARDVVRLKEDGKERPARGTHALQQMCTHFQALQKHVRIGTDWVKPCLALPCFPGPNYPEKNTIIETGKMRKRFEEYLNGNPEHKAIKPQLLMRSTLENPNELKKWLRDMMEIPSTEGASHKCQDQADPGRTQHYSTLLAWLLLHCMGIVIFEVSKGIEKETDTTVSDLLDSIQGQTENTVLELLDSKSVQTVALLTPDQKRLYNSTPGRKLILGASGTGKTFLGVQKLISLEKQGRINALNPGFFVTASKNLGLVSLVTKQLRKWKKDTWIRVRTVEKQVSDLTELLNEIKAQQTSYLVIDQMEDFEAFFSSDLFPSILDSERFGLLWLMANPFDMDSGVEGRKAAEYAAKVGTDSGRCLILNRRIRNTKKICSALDAYEVSHTFLARFAPEPGSLSNAGIPVFGYFVEDIEWEGNQKKALSRVLHALILEYGIPPETILVVTPSADFLEDLDDVLVQEFTQSARKNAQLRSMAPLVVRAPFEGEELGEEELDAVRKIYAPLLMPGSALTERHKVFLKNKEHLIRTHFKSSRPINDVDAFQDRLKDESSFALWVTMGLVRRFMTLASGTTGDGDKALDPLRKAMQSKEQLRKLILAHGCTSVLKDDEIRGYESDVVVIAAQGERGANRVLGDSRHAGRFFFNLPRALSRAKIKAVLVMPASDRKEVETCFGPVQDFFSG